jgi:hypothetical protein
VLPDCRVLVTVPLATSPPRFANSSLSNAPWIAGAPGEHSKREELQKRSVLLINRQLVKHDYWNEELWLKVPLSEDRRRSRPFRYRVYIASISEAYFCAIGLRLSFIVGVSSSPPGNQSSLSTMNFLIASTFET